MKKQVLSFLYFQFRRILLFFEWKKMRFLLSALQFGKELLEVKGETERGETPMYAHSLHPQDAVHGFGCSQQVFCRAKFAFAERSAAMKAPVGLLSDRFVIFLTGRTAQKSGF